MWDIKELIEKEIYKNDTALVNEALKQEFFKYDNIINEYDEEQDENAEVMQWFSVSEWLAGHLKNNNGVILNNDFGYWWGRCGCGYYLEEEEILQDIIKDLNNY